MIQAQQASFAVALQGPPPCCTRCSLQCHSWPELFDHLDTSHKLCFVCSKPTAESARCFGLHAQLDPAFKYSPELFAALYSEDAKAWIESEGQRLLWHLPKPGQAAPPRRGRSGASTASPQAEVINSLLYGLFDPRVLDHDPKDFKTFLEGCFYIGVGTAGRPFDHLRYAIEAKRQSARQPGKVFSEKIAKILDIWSGGEGVVIKTFEYPTIINRAFITEASMIHALTKQFLTNKINGHFHGTSENWTMREKVTFGVFSLLRFFSSSKDQYSPSIQEENVPSVPIETIVISTETWVDVENGGPFPKGDFVKAQFLNLRRGQEKKVFVGLTMLTDDVFVYGPVYNVEGKVQTSFAYLQRIWEKSIFKVQILKATPKKERNFEYVYIPFQDALDALNTANNRVKPVHVNGRAFAILSLANGQDEVPAGVLLSKARFEYEEKGEYKCEDGADPARRARVLARVADDGEVLD